MIERFTTATTDGQYVHWIDTPEKSWGVMDTRTFQWLVEPGDYARAKQWCFDNRDRIVDVAMIEITSILPQ